MILQGMTGIRYLETLLTSTLQQKNFCRTLTEAIQRNIPKIKMLTKATNKLWFNLDLHRLRQIRDRLYHRYRKSEETTKSKSSTIHAAYKAVRNYYVAKLSKAEQQFYHQLDTNLSLNQLKSSPRRWWKLAKTALGQSYTTGIPAIKSNAGKLVVDIKEKAELLNSYFASQCTLNISDCLTTSTSQPPVLTSVKCSFTFDHISESDVLEQLRKLDRFKSCGMDEIRNAVLVSAAGRIAETLAKIFNASLLSGRFPSIWKVSVVILIPKGRGDRAAVSSYRLISLTSRFRRFLRASFTNS